MSKKTNSTKNEGIKTLEGMVDALENRLDEFDEKYADLPFEEKRIKKDFLYKVRDELNRKITDLGGKHSSTKKRRKQSKKKRRKRTIRRRKRSKHMRRKRRHQTKKSK